MAEILKGAPVAKAISQQVALRSAELAQRGITPTLAIVRVGDRPDDISYEKGAVKRCDSCGISVCHVILSADVSQDKLISEIKCLNNDHAVHGILMFRPLPRHIDEAAVCDSIAPEKDMDGVTEGSMAGIFSGSGKGHTPCTAQACIEILDHYGVELRGKHAVIVGRSNVIGKPAAMLMLGRNATVTICHTKTAGMEDECRRADIIVAAAGKAKVISADHVSHSQVVLDVGINVTPEGKLTGDVDFDTVEPIVSAITPVPGGVGSVTTAVLAKHVVEAAEAASK